MEGVTKRSEEGGMIARDVDKGENGLGGMDVGYGGGGGVGGGGGWGVGFFFFQAEDGIRDSPVTGVQTCALPIYQYFARRHVTKQPESKRNYPYTFAY